MRPNKRFCMLVCALCWLAAGCSNGESVGVMLCRDGYDVTWLKSGRQHAAHEVDQILVVRLVDPTRGVGASVGAGRIRYKRNGTVYAAKRGQVVVVDERGVLPASVLAVDAKTRSRFLQLCEEQGASAALRMLASETMDSHVLEYLKEGK